MPFRYSRSGHLTRGNVINLLKCSLVVEAIISVSLSRKPQKTHKKKGIPMEGVSLIGFLVVGLIAGWLGGKIMRGGGFGFFGNLIVGVVGAFLGGILFNALGITAFGFVGALVTATVGAVVLLFIVGLIRRG